MRLALVADTHTTRCTEGEQPFYRERFARVIAQVNTAEVDLIVIAGDLTDGGLPEQYADFRSQIQAFRAPVLLIPGRSRSGPRRR